MPIAKETTKLKMKKNGQGRDSELSNNTESLPNFIIIGL